MALLVAGSPEHAALLADPASRGRLLDWVTSHGLDPGMVASVDAVAALYVAVTVYLPNDAGELVRGEDGRARTAQRIITGVAPWPF